MKAAIQNRHMLIDGSRLRDMAAAFDQIGRELAPQTSSPDVSSLGEELIETGARFRAVAPEIDLEDYSRSELRQFKSILNTLMNVSAAAYSPERRTDEQCVAIGHAADKLSIGPECRRIANELGKILVEYPEV